MKKSVVVVPIYQKEFNSKELISLRCLRKKLYKKYEINIITFKENISYIKLNPLFKGYRIKIFNKRYFTYQGYNKLLKSSIFYESFNEFNYMLIYQTDCLIFEDSLEYWINKNYDYVGSPWIKKLRNGNFKMMGVGNGGLSLRNIKSFINICNLYKNPFQKIKIFFRNALPSIPTVFYKLVISRDYPKYHIGCRNEDIFFSYVSKQLDKGFKIASIGDALKFGFEKYPEFCYKKNKNKLPLGCHAWQKYNKEFWKKFI